MLRICASAPPSDLYLYLPLPLYLCVCVCGWFSYCLAVNFSCWIFLVICATLIITMATGTGDRRSKLKLKWNKAKWLAAHRVGGDGLQRQSLTILAEKSFQFVTICCSGLCKLAALVVVAPLTLKTFSLRLHFHSSPFPPFFTWYLVYSSFAVRQLQGPVLCSICQKQCYKWPLMCSQLMCQAGLRLRQRLTNFG